MSAATITVPMSQWNRVLRTLDKLEKHILSEPVKPKYVKAAKVMKETGLTGQTLRRLRNDNPDLVVLKNKRYAYNLEEFKKLA